MELRLGLVIDQERCIGCEACTVACKNENSGSTGFIRVRTENVDQKDTPDGSYPELKLSFMPLVCNHCDNPPCADACPIDAITIREGGIVVLDREACNSCLNCIDACPYGAVFFQAENEVVEKCNLCIHRIDKGLEPFCVICCEGQAISFGNLNDPESKASRMARSDKAFQLLAEQGTGPSVYYLPPNKPRGV